jgi:hypothetical protein
MTVCRSGIKDDLDSAASPLDYAPWRLARKIADPMPERHIKKMTANETTGKVLASINPVRAGVRWDSFIAHVEPQADE